MNAVTQAAFLSVGRGCGFAGLAVMCVVLALSFQPVLAAQVGAILTLILCLILVVFAYRAISNPYKSTETWIILPEVDRPPEATAQKVIGETLRDTYFWFAKYAAAIATLLFAMSAVLSMTEVLLA